jgi:hypothetical protein
MKHWNNSNYGNDIELLIEDAENMYHQGQCDSDVKEGMEIPYIKEQLEKIDEEQLRKELDDFGAWDDEELNDHQENLMRWLWISAGDVLDKYLEENS